MVNSTLSLESSSPTIPVEKAQALAALHELQTALTPRSIRLRNFLLSLAAFAAVGWLFTLLLGGAGINLTIVMLVLFVHEAGHYLGMRAFGYRNLKMFFIPLFGAAVSGYGRVPVHQESIVYLLGPVPGIYIGCVCGGIYFVSRVEAWRELAVTFVVINALNLAPLYPLDGGRFIFGLLPQRTYRLQWILQLVLATGLLAASFGLHIVGIGGLIGFALGGSYHLAKTNQLAYRLRTCSIPFDCDAALIPDAAASELVDLVKAEYNSSKPKVVAEIAWQVWTRVTARRPQAIDVCLLVGMYVLVLLSILLAYATYWAYIPQ